MACDDFGAAEADGVTRAASEAIPANSRPSAFAPMPARRTGLQGRLWGGNLTVLQALLGTPHCPISGGILFLEDTNEHPYRMERMLQQLHQAGVLGGKRQC
jgi:muramoyltetrapeptide carboxypeptidase